MNLLNKNRALHIAIIFRIYLLACFVFFVFRLLALFVNFFRLESIEENERISVLIKSFVIGWRFDTVISCYVIALPFLLLWIAMYLQRRWRKLFRKISFWTITLGFTFSFFICAIDIPYFQHFFSRLSVAAFQWTESPLFVMKMTVQEPRYWWPIIPFLLSLVFFFKFQILIFRRFEGTHEASLSVAKTVQSIILSIFCALLIFIGIRGRIEKKSPIRVGTAYFSNYAFANLLALNPVYTLQRSYAESLDPRYKSIQLMDDQAAIKSVQKDFGIVEEMQSPLMRSVSPDSQRPQNRKNVVLIIMESMSASKMGRYGNPNKLTPTLDSLANRSYVFDNIYSSGIHTFNGIYSTLFSFPALFQQHPMKAIDAPPYQGIASTMQKHNYSTIYFTTHDGQFDNVEGFLRKNDYQQIVTQKDYPNEKVVSTLGVPDDFMFEFSIPILTRLHQQGDPFLSVFMTASDHGPYYVPPYYSVRHNDLRKQTVAYADWSINKFLTLAQSEPWFDNTLFVFVADHGESMNDAYSMPLTYHHIPFILYSPTWLQKPKSFSKPGGQIDVYPTIMGLLNLPYVNTTMGVDLIKKPRPAIYFCADDKYGVINDTWYLIVNTNGIETLHKYNQQDNKDYYTQYPEVVRELKSYAQSHMQTAQWIIKNP
jgi:phosphoglycerol transferase MdoB-like AlkP superfamily enzyme